ncbi:MAG TPA: hypothetical protein VGN95_15640 [Pyrinomonadaceae bacterium]|jgi:hypothetical protein|nr:hypothetical protein [Pyrinomonadaceae bacterium]
MSLAIKISLLSSGLFLLAGMLIGILKYQRIMTSPEHRAPVYVDIAHRAAFLYSFAMLVIAKLLEFNPYSTKIQVGAVAAVLAFLTLTVLGYLRHGIMDDTDNLFRERNFTTTFYMYLLIVGEVGGLSVILWGFISTQII